MGFILEGACISNIGKRRANNEDNFFFDGLCMEEVNDGTHNPLCCEHALRDKFCVAVFDGMGGENYGESASFAAAAKLQEFITIPPKFYIPERKYLQNMTMVLNDAVVQKAEELLTTRMGTTMAALYFTPRNVYCCNLGDSRIYRLRDRVFSQLSEDHVSKSALYQGKKAPLTQHLGMPSNEIRLEPYIAKGELQKDDIYLICSDGLTDMVDNNAIVDILLSGNDVADIAQMLVNQALLNGGRDNVTVILCRLC